MKAILYKGVNRLEVGELPKPEPGPDEVLLKVHDCGICGSDLHAVQHGFGLTPNCVMGHEFCGEVAELGPKVSGFAAGERVTALPFYSCDTCHNCRRGQPFHCVKLRPVGLGSQPGAYAEYVVCHSKTLLKLPDHLTSRQGALVEPLAVGLHGIYRSRLGPGSSCIVMGAGPIGLATLLWCKAKGAETVVVSELAARRYELAQKLGASAVVNPREYNPAAKLKELTAAEPDVVFECIGVKSTLHEAIGFSAICGQVVVLGVCMEPDQIMPLYCTYKEVTIDFALGYTRAEFEETIAALAGAKLDPVPMVTDIIGLDDVPAAFEALRKPTSQAKVMIEFPH